MPRWPIPASTRVAFSPSKLSLPRTTYDVQPRRAAFVNALLARLRVPGVEAAGVGIAMPFSGGAFGEYFRRVTDTSVNDAQIGRLHFVSSGYLEALGARLSLSAALDDHGYRSSSATARALPSSVRRRRARSSVRNRRSVNV